MNKFAEMSYADQQNSISQNNSVSTFTRPSNFPEYASDIGFNPSKQSQKKPQLNISSLLANFETQKKSFNTNQSKQSKQGSKSSGKPKSQKKSKQGSKSSGKKKSQKKSKQGSKSSGTQKSQKKSKQGSKSSGTQKAQKKSQQNPNVKKKPTVKKKSSVKKPTVKKKSSVKKPSVKKSQKKPSVKKPSVKKPSQVGIDQSKALNIIEDVMKDIGLKEAEEIEVKVKTDVEQEYGGTSLKGTTHELKYIIINLYLNSLLNKVDPKVEALVNKKPEIKREMPKDLLNDIKKIKLLKGGQRSICHGRTTRNSGYTEENNKLVLDGFAVDPEHEEDDISLEYLTRYCITYDDYLNSLNYTNVVPVLYDVFVMDPSVESNIKTISKSHGGADPIKNIEYTSPGEYGEAKKSYVPDTLYIPSIYPDNFLLLSGYNYTIMLCELITILSQLKIIYDITDKGDFSDQLPTLFITIQNKYNKIIETFPEHTGVTFDTFTGKGEKTEGRKHESTKILEIYIKIIQDNIFFLIKDINFH